MNMKREINSVSSPDLAKAQSLVNTKTLSIANIDEVKRGDVTFSTSKISDKKLADAEVNEDVYINAFEEFSKNERYREAFDKIFSHVDAAEEECKTRANFDLELQAKGENTIFESISSIDKSKALQKIFKKTKLSDLSGEIMKLAGFVKSLPYLNKDNKKDSAIIFLVSLDYLVKGLFTHWQISLMDESEKTSDTKVRQKMKQEAFIMKQDIKYNILIGDQFHAKAYYMTSRLGNNDLCKILTTIEENFAKILFRDGYNGNKKHNLKKLYKDFYNYLPTFFGQGFKGVAIIYEMGATSVDESFKLGIEYGF